MSNEKRRDLTHDLFLPTLLFVALGAMTWAVRGCSGFGATKGCIFAGVTWGAAWWFIARDPGAVQSRRYASGWIILALTIGIGMAGARGWMQWPSFFAGQLLTNGPAGKSVPISRTYGFVWLFIAGVPWAGLGACMLAWTSSERQTRTLHWAFRIACGVGMAVLARILFDRFPQVFLPLYESLKFRYENSSPKLDPNLRRLIGDNRAAIIHLGLYLGFLLYEFGRRDWKNVTLILTVGLVNGLGWSLCQNWHWASEIWPSSDFNFWRCWESSGGISIGVAYGIAYYLVNRKASHQERLQHGSPHANRHPNVERLATYSGLVLGLGLSIMNGLRGWANIYIGNEQYWGIILWRIMAPVMLLCFLALAIWIWRRPLPRKYEGDVFPHAYAIVWTVVITQNILAQLVTGPFQVWNETVFNIYYILLFLISAAILVHYQFVKLHSRTPESLENSVGPEPSREPITDPYRELVT